MRLSGSEDSRDASVADPVTPPSATPVIESLPPPSSLERNAEIRRRFNRTSPCEEIAERLAARRAQRAAARQDPKKPGPDVSSRSRARHGRSKSDLPTSAMDETKPKKNSEYAEHTEELHQGLDKTRTTSAKTHRTMEAPEGTPARARHTTKLEAFNALPHFNPQVIAHSAINPVQNLAELFRSVRIGGVESGTTAQPASPASVPPYIVRSGAEASNLGRNTRRRVSKRRRVEEPAFVIFDEEKEAEKDKKRLRRD